VDPVQDPLLLRKSGSAGNQIRTSGSVTRNSDHYSIEAVDDDDDDDDNNNIRDCHNSHHHSPGSISSHIIWDL
jgi:hypothetical protein